MGDDGGGGWSSSCDAGGDSFGGGGGGMDHSSNDHGDHNGVSWSTCGLGKDELKEIPWADNDSSGEKADTGIWEKRDVDQGVDAAGIVNSSSDSRRDSAKKNGASKELIGPGGGGDCCCLL